MRSAVSGPTRMATRAQRVAMSLRSQMAHLADTIEVAMRKLSSANSPPGSAASGRTSAISLHLLQRIFGTMIRAAPDRDAARAVVDRAESSLETEDLCPFCNIMLAVPAVIACADVGDLDRARNHLQVADKSLHLWEGTSWQAAVLEARAHLADAEGDTSRPDGLRREAAELFDGSGQPLDAARCRAASAA